MSVAIDAITRTPRKGTQDWLLWMLEGTATLYSERHTPVSPWKHALAYVAADGRHADDSVSASRIAGLVQKGALTPKIVESKPGCWDRIEYTLRHRRS